VKKGEKPLAASLEPAEGRDRQAVRQLFKTFLELQQSPATEPAPPPNAETQNPRNPESQHGRGLRGTLWVTQSNPLPKQGHPEQAAQHRVQAGLEYLQSRLSSVAPHLS